MEIPKSLELVRIIRNLVITTQSSIFFAFIFSEQVQKSSCCVEPCTKEQQLHSNRTLLAHSLCLLASFSKLVASDM